jgi:V8-like Glu-specific endopeptidase
MVMCRSAKNFSFPGLTLSFLLSAMGLAQAQSSDVSVSSSTATPTPAQKLDYGGATPLPVPKASDYSDADAQKAMVNALTPAAAPLNFRIPGSTRGNIGDGEKNAVSLGTASPQPRHNTAIALDFGTANLPFSTARADLDPAQTNEQYPYRAAGKLFFKIGAQDFICSASLIKKGLVVTAAHCVMKFGSKSYYSDWQFAPGFRAVTSPVPAPISAPYGIWTAAQAFVLTSYFDGSDSCQQTGVVCQNDVAILALNPQKDASGKDFYAGGSTGWFAFGWDRAGFTSQKITHVTQIGYPACLDDGGMMERNDAQGATDSAHSENTILGSLMCGGSSGGPWLVNFGIRPALTGTSLGSAPIENQIVGVTSWGSTDNAVKWMGASPFLSSNVVVLVNSACKAYPEACKE